MKNEKFSVLISVYDKEKPDYFDAALKSVYEQTVIPSEVVICKDGKLTMELDKVIKKYKTLYADITKVVCFRKNRGLGLTLRDGLLECSNEIVFRMDSDDISMKDRFEKQLKVLKETGVDVVGGNIVEYDEKMEKIIGHRKTPANHDEIIGVMKKRNAINHMAVAYKKDKVLESGNYMEMLGFEDYYLWIRMTEKGCRFYNLQEDLVKVRGGNEMMKRRGGNGYTKNIRVFEKTIYDMGFIGLLRYMLNISERVLVSKVPNSVRLLIYKKALRK